MASSDMPRWDVYPIRNRAKGRLPVAATWDVNPTNLANATDGDFDTVTGTGSKAILGIAELGRITMDLGAAYSVNVRAKLGMWSTAGNVYVTLYYSVDNIAWYNAFMGGAFTQVVGNVAEYIVGCNLQFVRARYIRLQFVGSVAQTGYVKIYEVQAIDLGI